VRTAILAGLHRCGRLVSDDATTHHLYSAALVCRGGVGRAVTMRADLQVVQADPRADLISTIDIGSWANVHPVGL
jgi:hypothetical protein